MAEGADLVLSVRFSPSQLARITCVWIVAVATCGMLMAISEKSHLPWNIMIVVALIWLGGGAFGLLRVIRQLDRLALDRDRLTLDQLALPAFIRINVYVLLVMAALVGNALW